MPAADYSSKARGYARAFGQDLMRGEHVVGAGVTDPGLTWVGGDRSGEDLDDVSRKILAAQPQNCTSIFDHVLCEMVYRWFCPPGGAVLDPFAGGSVRGIIAVKLGRSYTGVDLRAEQTEANRDAGGVGGMTEIERTDQDDQLVIPEFETTTASRDESITVQMAETLEKRGAAIRMKDWDCAEKLLEEYRRLDGVLDRQDDLFNSPEDSPA